MTTLSEKFSYASKKQYEVTCSFENKYQYRNNELNTLRRLEDFTNFLTQIYLPKWQNCNYEFITELSNSQKVDHFTFPRLHLHGVISFDNDAQLLLFKLNTLSRVGRYGNIQINPYRPKYWRSYMTKDYKIFKKSIKELTLPKEKPIKIKFKHPNKMPDMS